MLDLRHSTPRRSRFRTFNFYFLIGVQMSLFHSPNVSIATFVDFTQSDARNAGLLSDPARSHAPTKPTPTYNQFRICAHESAHACIAHRLGMTVAKVTTFPRNGALGETFYSNGSRLEEAVIILAGREGEIALLGDAGSGDGSDTRLALKLARDEAGGDEGKTAELMRAWRQVAKKMVVDNKRAISKLAFELHRRRELTWDHVAAVIDAASKRSECRTTGR